jgi:hypothetical protein
LQLRAPAGSRTGRTAAGLAGTQRAAEALRKPAQAKPLTCVDEKSPDHQNVVEVFNNLNPSMPTVNFSVPEDVKQAFNAAYEGQNKSAVIADLMREAVARAERRRVHRAAVERMLAARAAAPSATEAAFRVAREAGRP